MFKKKSRSCVHEAFTYIQQIEIYKKNTVKIICVVLPSQIVKFSCIFQTQVDIYLLVHVIMTMIDT